MGVGGSEVGCPVYWDFQANNLLFLNVLKHELQNRTPGKFEKFLGKRVPYVCTPYTFKKYFSTSDWSNFVKILQKWPKFRRILKFFFFQNYVSCAFCTQIIKKYLEIYNTPKFLKINFYEICTSPKDYHFKISPKKTVFSNIGGGPPPRLCHKIVKIYAIFINCFFLKTSENLNIENNFICDSRT